MQFTKEQTKKILIKIGWSRKRSEANRGQNGPIKRSEANCGQSRPIEAKVDQ